MTVAKAGLQRRKLDPVGEQLALVAEMAQRVVGERLERLGDPALLVGERDRERRLGELDARLRAACRCARASRPATVTRLAVGELVEEVRPGSVDETDAGPDELERPGVRETGPRWTARR